MAKKAKGKASAATRKTTSAPVKEAFSKSELLTSLAEETGLSKKQVGGVLDGLADTIERHIKSRAVGEFKMPGLFKIKTVKKPATKARKGINPFTGEETVFKAKPARTIVKVIALKKLKEMVSK